MSESIEIIIKVRDLASKALKDFKKAIKDINEYAQEASEQDVDKFTESVEEADETTEGLGESLKKISEFEPDGLLHTFDGLRDTILGVRDAAEEAYATLEQVSQVGKDIIKNQAGKSLFGAGATKLAGNFSKAIGEVGTLVDTAIVSTEELSNTVLDLSAAYGVDKFDVSKALYQGISAGAEAGAEANKLLETSIKGAIAGATTTEVVIDGLTTVINAFKFEMDDAANVSDIMFTTMKNGKTTIEELSSFMFQAAPLSKSLGVSFEELNASLIAMTLQGTPTSQAMTGIRAALVGMIRPTGGAADAFAAVGYESGTAAIQAEGFAGALAILETAADGDAGALTEMLGSVQAVQAVLQNTGENAVLFANGMEQINNAAGASDVALATMEDTLDSVLQKMQKSSNAVFTLFGQALGDTLTPLIKLVTGFFRLLKDLIQTFPTLTRVIVGFLAVIVSLKVAFGLLLIAGSGVITMMLKFFIFRTIGTLIGVLTGNLSSLKLALDAVTVAMTRLIGAGAVAGLKTAFLTLGGAVLSLTSKFLLLLGLPSIAGVFAGGAAAATKLGGATWSLVGIYNKMLNIVPIVIAKFAALKVSVLGLGAAFVASSALMKATFIGVLIAAGIAIYKFIDAYTDWWTVQGKLNDSIKEQEKIIKDLEKSGAREVEIKSAEELLLLSKRQIDDYQAQLLMKLKLADAEYLIANSSGESKKVLDAKWAVRNKILALLHATYARERELIKTGNEQADAASRLVTAKQKALDLTKQLQALDSDEATLDRQGNTLLANLNFERKVLQDANKEKSKLLRAQLKADEISVADYWANVTALAQESIAVEVEIEEQKIENKKQVQALGLQALAIQEQQVLATAKTNKADDTEIALIEETFALKRTTLQTQHAIELDDLENNIKELGQKEKALIAENNANALVGSKDYLNQSIKDEEDAEAERTRLQQEAFDRELTAILLQQVAKRKAVEDKVGTGETSAFQSGFDLKEVDDETLAKLEALKEKQAAYNATVQDPNNQIALAGLEDTITTLSEAIEVNAARIKTGLVDGLATAFESLADGSKNAKDAFSDFAKDFLRMILKMITQSLALQAINATLGAGGAGLFSGGGSVQKASAGGYIEASQGGIVYAAEGGYITGKGTATSDDIPARLSNGEYVVNAGAVGHYGLDFIEALNRKLLPHASKALPRFQITRPRRANFASGGAVGGQTNNDSKSETSIRVINNVDPDLVEGFMQSREGEETILNLISNNTDKIRGMLG